MRINGSIHLLHGFLGRGFDWQFFAEQSHYSTIAYDLFAPNRPSSIPKKLPVLGQWINHQALQTQGPRILIGYSLGGRIALHSLVLAAGEYSSLWSGAVIVSAHPGMTRLEPPSGVNPPVDLDQRDSLAQQDHLNQSHILGRSDSIDPALQALKATRVRQDEVWAHRFLTDPWDLVISDWNQQMVFKGGGDPLPRSEAEFSRQGLADLMVGCSLGSQNDLRPELTQLNLPILWISGEHDAKYTRIAEEMVQLNPRFKQSVVPNAAHRVPWDQPSLFMHEIEKFLGQL